MSSRSSEADRPLVFPPCPRCGEPCELHAMPANADRAGLSYFRCTAPACGDEHGHSVEREVGLPSNTAEAA